MTEETYYKAGHILGEIGSFNSVVQNIEHGELFVIYKDKWENKYLMDVLSEETKARIDQHIQAIKETILDDMTAKIQLLKTELSKL